MELNSFYIIGLVLAGFLVAWPEETINTLIAVGLKIQIFYLNYRMKFAAWRIYRRLCVMAEEAGLPSPGPFVFVNIWDRDR